MRARQWTGLLILALVLISVIGYSLWQTGSLDPSQIGASTRYERVILRGYVGGEKIGFLEDPEVQDILRRRYAIELDYVKAGSIEMVRGDTSGMDYLWPSSQVALEIFKTENGALAADELIFNSPIVLYSWDMVADALEQQQLVTRIGEAYYTVDLSALVEAVVEERTWADVGLPQLYGTMRIVCTDPTKSNSGNQFFGLLANTLNGGEVVDEERLRSLLPTIQDFYDRLGFMHHSSGDLFSQYLKQGIGAYPLVVGYESQIVEFGLENEASLAMIQDKTRILYPQPTVWSSHPLIALNDTGRRLIEALMDPEVQSLAWMKHGFRTGLPGVQDDPSVLSVAGIPATIDQVTPMPNAAVMARIIETLED